MRKSGSFEEGFTLVEVLVAFAILAGAVIVSFRIFGDGLYALSVAQERQKEADVVRLEFATARAAGSLAEGSFNGTTDGVAWTITVAPIEDVAAPGTSLLRPYRVTVSTGNAIVIDTIELLRARP